MHRGGTFERMRRFIMDPLLGKSRIVPKKKSAHATRERIPLLSSRRVGAREKKRKLFFRFVRTCRRLQWRRRFFLLGGATRQPGFIEDAILGKNDSQRT